MKPNILLVNCDDMGFGDLGCYGSKLNDTKTIDALAKEGIKFNSCYASSAICSPSRASLMTGCYAQRVSIPDVLFPASKTGLDNSEFTMANLFKNAGYNTMLVGKWHCGDSAETLPLKFGFDDYYGLPYSNDMGRQVKMLNSNTKDYNCPLPLFHGDEIIQQQPDQTGITERYTEKSVEFIRKSVKENKQFFLYFAHMHVHVPLYEQERFLRESRNGDFGACVASIDWSLSVLIDELKRQNIYEDTMIIFTSDNGSCAKYGASNGELRGAKFSSFEGGFRIPFIVHWKNHIKEGIEVNNLLTHMDLLPSFASLIGEDLGERPIDGIDVLPMLMGEDTEMRDEFAYYLWYHLSAVRKNNFKLFVGCPDGFATTKELLPEVELYDLDKDICEKHNIAKENPEKVEELMKLIEKYRALFGDTFTGVKGSEVRDCAQIENPQTLTEYDENHPYIISMYDKNEYVGITSMYDEK